MAPIIVNKEDKIKQIARAALKLFSQKGYQATSVSRIAQTAGIGKGTIYEYFATKEEIFLAAIMEWSAQFNERIVQKSEGVKDPVQRLYIISETMCEICDPEDLETMRIIYEVMQQALVKNGVLFKKRHLVREMLIESRQMVVDILLDGISNGLFRPEIASDAERIAVNFLAFLDGVGLHSLVSENYLNLKEQIDFYLHHLLKMILEEPVTN
ncbi:MAG: TetR/AcrR family transcriptional regulator [Desulfobacterales bacterium]